ncbi:hypothetical protein ABL78_0321 [Leptomonas seymouri]|uniref:Mkiaa0324 protein-like protein n=1 Tax=Leptomonas seymouri TaxID=5684 RepID=A0A0N1I3V1_LEPSE|nr:hypothetical protein ABL78_0321 [Leptomonas seymouri]|eukprot:KPI90561.1 hypothetical protein ABL78_0321 [Leptomonas seymouri]
MLSRSFAVLARSRPPFAVFYKSMSSTLATTAAPQRMQMAGVLWRRTAPKYGIRFSVPRVTAAKQIYSKERSRLAKGIKAAAKPSRRSSKAKTTTRQRKAPAAQKKRNKSRRRPYKRMKATRAKAARAKAVKKAARAKPTKKAVTPYASFTASVLREAKLSPTPTNKNRVFRAWILTGQQRSLSLQKRIAMAVRLLKKDRRSKRKLSKKMTRKGGQKKTRPSAKTRRTAAKKVRSAGSVVAKKSKSRKGRIAPHKKATARRRIRKAAATKSKTRNKATRRTPASKTRARRAAVHRPKVQGTRKRRNAAAKSKARRLVSKKKTPSRTAQRHKNPYIDFYRRMRMTGLLPNSPKVVGSRRIKQLWARTHSLPNMDARVAQATKILEAQTGAKAKTETTPVFRKVPVAPAKPDPTAMTLKDIKVPSYYEQNPFGATYAALLPMLQDTPSSTRMAHVAKAWTNTTLKDDHRSAKQRIAAVAQELKK